MRFHNNLKLGVLISILVILLFVGILINPVEKQKDFSEQNSIFLSGSDDLYEPNDDPLSAYDLSMFEDFWLSSVNGIGILEDDDFYKITINAGHEHLIVNLFFMHTLGNIDIEIYDSTAIFIVGEYSLNDDEYIDYTLPGIGDYYIRVFGPNTSNSYDMLWKGMPLDDYYEENDGILSAYDLSAYPASWLPFGMATQGDDDWYKVYLDPGEERLRADLAFSHSAGNIEIEIYDSGYSYITGSYSTDDNEYIDIILPSNGIYYILIYGVNAGNSYDLWWEDLSSTGGDDIYEENDFDWQTYDISSYEGWWLSGISGHGFQFDDDWYGIFIPDGHEYLKVEVTFNHFAGDINVELYDTKHNWIEGSYSIDDNEYIEVFLSGSEAYYIRVYGANTGNSYDLRYETFNEGNEGPYNPNGMIPGSEILIFLISYVSIVSIVGLIIMMIRR